MVSGGAVCLKYLLLILNLIFFILGICILYFGFSSIQEFKEYEEFTVENPTVFIVILIVIGFAVLTLSFFGCVGAFKENSCLLMTFSSILSVYILIELVCIVYIFAFKSHLKDTLTTGIDGKIDKYDTTGQEVDQTVNRLIDDLQFKMKCCGARNASDWNRVFKNSTMFPKSCCPSDKLIELDDVCPKPYDKGCVDALVHFLSFSIGTVTMAVLICQFFAIIFACTLYQSIRTVSYGIV